MTKKIFFDARYIRIDHHDGISRFSAGLAKELHALTDITVLIHDLRQLQQLPEGIKFARISAPTSALEPLVALQINKLSPDIVFTPMQTMGSFGRKYKLVLTIHDLIYYRHPAPPPAFNAVIRLLWRLYHLSFAPQRLLLNRADHVVTVSETTKQLIADHKLTKLPVEVIYNAADENYADAARAKPKTKNLVYMGSFMDYKNVETLVRGMQFLPEFNLQLLSRISDARKHELAAKIPVSGGTVEFLNGVSEDQYHDLLNQSFALVSASLDEGFGIPLVEAMNRAIPVVVSDIEIFREVAGKAGTFFEASSEQGFAAAIESLSTAEWKQKSFESLDRAKSFSWKISAKKLLKLLNRV
ncbi:MAG: hypothetical protein RLY13_154 [Actinomycetota bacterium]|jgi:glycosyltransferase involved in cell wall biosynthesis